MPNSETDVKIFADLRGKLPCRTFLPRKTIVELCQDKFKLAAYLKRHRLPVPLTYVVTSLARVDEIFRWLAPRTVLWCRIRRGSGSMGAIPVKSPEQACGWIRYWQEMRGIPPQSFTLSEYLPGRDYCVQSLWKQGKLVLVRMHERLSYYVAGSSASGVSSTAGLAKIILKPRVARMCSSAVRALDPRASGVYFVDVKENERGTPCITEINAGRFANVTTIHDTAAKHNMAATYVRLALGAPVDIRNPYEPAGNCYVTRDLDMVPAIFRESELLKGIEEAGT
jgi:glutathione synthase/RimK-type ligase-like ATP-grasp enzyme